MRYCLQAAVMFAALYAGAPASPIAAAVLGSDTYTITLDPAARSEPATGRLILFFITATERPWPSRAPADGPFFEKPQPIASIAVKDFKPGQSVVVDNTAVSFPCPLNELDGPVRVQAVLDCDQTERGHEQGPGNLFSDTLSVRLSRDRDDAISLSLVHRLEAPKLIEQPNLKWIDIRSEMLSANYGREVHHRAGVALPQGYDDPALANRRWPAFYVIPGFGGRHDEAESYAAMLESQGIEEIAPIGVYIVLDPESPLGHHGFVDSPNHGPRGAALLKELIPYLESHFRLAARPEARIVTGHSSGGWSALWLALSHPDVFGACWASAPDPIDFTAFQMTNLYEDQSMYVDAAGREVPSYRRPYFNDSSGEFEMRPVMTVRQECGMERALDPEGGSGQQWDAWEAMFSPRDDGRKMPARMFDRLSGHINRDIVQHWSRFDIARLVESDWPRYGPIIINRVRLACGDEDSYYLNRAVERFREKVRKLAGDAKGDGYIVMVHQATHETLVPQITMRWNKEMRDYLQKLGLQDPDKPSQPPVRRRPQPR